MSWIKRVLTGRFRRPEPRWLRQVREAMPPRVRDPNQPIEALRLRAGWTFERRIRLAVRYRQNIMVWSDPGVGKTVSIEKVLKEEAAAGRILGYLTLTATKSTDFKHWFDKRLTIQSRDGEPRMELLPSVVESVHPREIETDDVPQGDVWILVDEITRGNSILIDAFLECVESSAFLVDGRKVKLNIRFIFAGNLAGSDASCQTMAPAFKSRNHEIVILYSADIDVMARVYLPLRAANFAARVSRKLRNPSVETATLMSAVWLVCNGYPLSREAYSETPAELLRLVEKLAALDPHLKADLLEIAARAQRGPDARKPLQWWEQAAARALDRGADTVTEDDLLETCAVTFRAGYRVRLNEDRQRREFLALDQTTSRVARRLFTNLKLRRAVAEHVGPFGLSDDLATAVGVPVEQLAQRVADYFHAVTDEFPAEAAEHLARVGRFARAAAADPSPGRLVEHAKAHWLNRDGSWRRLRDQELYRTLVAAATGPTVFALADLAAQPVEPRALVRDLLQRTRHAYEFAPEFIRFARRVSDNAAIRDAVQTIDRMLAGEPVSQPPRPVTLLAVRVAGQANREYQSRVRKAIAASRSAPSPTIPPPAAVTRPAWSAGRSWAAPVLVFGGTLLMGADYARASVRISPEGGSAMMWQAVLKLNPFVVLLGLVGLAALWLLFDRLFRMRRAATSPGPLADAIATGLGSAGSAAVEVEAYGSDAPLAQAARELLARPNPTDAPGEAADNAVDRAFAAVDRNTDLIGVMAQLAPMVGLAGSLWAMLAAVNATGGDPQGLATGFFRSLQSSLIGIAVAVPCLYAHGSFHRRSGRLADIARGHARILAHNLAIRTRQIPEGRT